MIARRVTPDGREAVVPLDVLDARGVIRGLEALIDTGFTDEFALPPSAAERLGFAVSGSVLVELADGRVRQLPVYDVDVIWHGLRRSVRAFAIPDQTLIGMALLGESRLTVEAWPDGEVLIAER